MNRTQQELTWACKELGLQLVLDYTVALKSGTAVRATALLPDLGGARGMLVVDAFDKVASIERELVQEGYGFVVLEEPQDLGFDLESHEEMFADWGWQAKDRPEPSWMASARDRISKQESEA